MALATFSYVPTETTQVTITPRVLRVQFGDGYMQEFMDGINGILQNWALIWSPIGTTDTTPSISDLIAFFTAQGGYQKFLWTPPAPLAVQGLYICSDWNWSYDQGKLCSFKCTFLQRPP